jgi:hypothetical protein
MEFLRAIRYMKEEKGNVGGVREFSGTDFLSGD